MYSAWARSRSRPMRETGAIGGSAPDTLALMWMRLFISGLLVAVCLCGFSQDRKKKPPDIEVVESKAHRTEDRVKLDGRVKVTAEKPLRGLIIIFDFISPEHAVISSEKTTVEEDAMP